jgi:hypothetical protein
LRKVVTFIGHFVIISILTLLTQIGGLVWLASLVLVSAAKKAFRTKRFILFLALYLTFTFILIPVTAPLGGREKIQNNEKVGYHTFFTVLCNRNYVTPALQQTLQATGSAFQKRYPGIKIVYLDACFPFLDRFPLLPHLSHNDGNKVDISFVYSNKEGELTNKKPSVSGYGAFETDNNSTITQTELCKSQGYFQYDFTKYLTLGIVNRELKFEAKTTAYLIQLLAAHKNTGKLFIEPHLKTRLKASNTKIRFHGCQAVRHDDHLHLQL